MTRRAGRILFAVFLTGLWAHAVLGQQVLQPRWTGLFVGVEGIGAFDTVDTTETTAKTGAVFHQFTSSGTGGGGGLNLGYNWPLWDGRFVAGGIASIDFMSNSAGHVVQVDDDIIGTVGGRGGYLVTPALLAYGETGLAVAEENTTLSFGSPTTTRLSRTATGYALGGGVEWALPAASLPAAGASLFIDYRHVWWDSGSVTRPAAVPGLDIRWQRDSNLVKAGLRLYF